jgi:predicted nucleic acid-binding protein
LANISSPLPFTLFHALEVRNAFRLGIFRGLLTAHQASAAWKNVQRDLRSGRLVNTTVKWPSIFRLAARLSEQHSAIHGTRSLDIVHIATAKVMKIPEFISFDSRQRSLCSAMGFKLVSSASG